MFKQLIEVKTSDADALVAHVNGYDSSSAVGLESAAIYKDGSRSDTYVIEALFTSREEAEKNNGRDETDRWAARLRELVEEEPSYRNLEQVSDLAGSKKGE